VPMALTVKTVQPVLKARLVLPVLPARKAIPVPKVPPELQVR
jgi:hypothetical protein